MKILFGYVERLVQAIGSIVPFGSRRRVADPDDLAAEIECSRPVPTVDASCKLLGRTVDFRGRPVDGMGPVAGLEPLPLYRPDAAVRPATRQPLQNAAAPGLFRGARASLVTGWPDAGRRLCDIARAHRGPVVAAMIGGGLLEHSLFSADLMEAYYRTVLISEPREERPYRALRIFRTAATLAAYFARGGDDVLMIVSWRLAVHATPAETTAPHDVTTIWSIEESASGFDCEISPEVVREKAA